MTEHTSICRMVYAQSPSIFVNFLRGKRAHLRDIREEENMPQYKFYAEMSCGGCSGAITRLLKKLDGVTDVKCDIEANEVVVVTDKDFDGVDAFMEKIGAWSTNAKKRISKTPIA